MPVYHVISTGIAEQQDETLVRRQVAALFNASEEQILPLLTQSKILKKLTDLHSAQHYQTVLEQAGLACYIQEQENDEDSQDALDSSWDDLSECPECGYYQPRIHECQNCGIQLFEQEELGQLNTEWEDLVMCESCHFMQPLADECRNCGDLFQKMTDT